MLKALFLTLNVKPGEERQVLLLLSVGFFMGTFLAIYQVSAETLFLNRLSEYLKEAILVSGFLGVLTTFLFSFIQDRVSFSKLAVLNLVAILCFTMRRNDRVDGLATNQASSALWKQKGSRA